MATITIIDTGYPNVDSSGAIADQSTDEPIANGGSAITFKCTSMSYNRGANLDNNPVPSKYKDMELNYGSTENPIITIAGVLDRRVDADMNLVSEFDALVTTKGIKCLYYNDSTDGYRDLTDDLGAANANDGKTNHPTEPHLHCRVKSFNISQVPKSSHCTYKLICEVTA